MDLERVFDVELSEACEGLHELLEKHGVSGCSLSMDSGVGLLVRHDLPLLRVGEQHEGDAARPLRKQLSEHIAAGCNGNWPVTIRHGGLMFVCAAEPVVEALHTLSELVR